MSLINSSLVALAIVPVIHQEVKKLGKFFRKAKNPPLRSQWARAAPNH